MKRPTILHESRNLSPSCVLRPTHRRSRVFFRNIFAIKSLLLGRYQAALKLFKKAELLTDPHKYR